jgi:DnaJ like chaperone protein
LENINIGIRFKVAVFFAFIGFVIGLSMTDLKDIAEKDDVRMAVALGMILGILGFSVLPYIFYELVGAYFKLYLISGDIGIAFIRMAMKVFEADGVITKEEEEKLDLFMQKEFGKTISAPLREFILEIRDKPEGINEIAKPLKQVNLTGRLDILHRLFSLATADRIFNNEEEQVLRKISRSLRIGEKRFEMVKENLLKEKGYRTKTADEEAKNRSWNFYMMDQLLKMTYNPYLVLEIEHDASDEMVKKAYRKMVKKHHPDKSMKKDSKSREHDAAKILEINEAYESIKKMRGLK